MVMMMDKPIPYPNQKIIDETLERIYQYLISYLDESGLEDYEWINEKNRVKLKVVHGELSYEASAEKIHVYFRW